MNMLEHPDITMAQATGYPKKPEAPMYDCDRCDHSIYEGEEYYKINGEILCEDCVKSVYGCTAGEE